MSTHLRSLLIAVFMLLMFQFMGEAAPNAKAPTIKSDEFRIKSARCKAMEEVLYGMQPSSPAYIDLSLDIEKCRLNSRHEIVNGDKL